MGYCQFLATGVICTVGLFDPHHADRPLHRTPLSLPRKPVASHLPTIWPKAIVNVALGNAQGKTQPKTFDLLFRSSGAASQTSHFTGNDEVIAGCAATGCPGVEYQRQRVGVGPVSRYSNRSLISLAVKPFSSPAGMGDRSTVCRVSTCFLSMVSCFAGCRRSVFRRISSER